MSISMSDMFEMSYCGQRWVSMRYMEKISRQECFSYKLGETIDDQIKNISMAFKITPDDYLIVKKFISKEGYISREIIKGKDYEHYCKNYKASTHLWLSMEWIDNNVPSNVRGHNKAVEKLSDIDKKVTDIEFTVNSTFPRVEARITNVHNLTTDVRDQITSQQQSIYSINGSVDSIIEILKIHTMMLTEIEKRRRNEEFYLTKIKELEEKLKRCEETIQERDSCIVKLTDDCSYMRIDH